MRHCLFNQIDVVIQENMKIHLKLFLYGSKKTIIFENKNINLYYATMVIFDASRYTII